MFRAAVLFLIFRFCYTFPADHDLFNPLGPWHRHKPPCGLPSFVDQLPVEAQNKIHEIWNDYKEGTDCDEKHQQTREVIHTLPEQLKYSIFSGRCGPSFLRNVSKTVRNEFRAVWFTHRLSAQEKELRLKKLAYSLLSGESLALFYKWEEELQVRKAEFAEKVAKLSPDARDSLEKWKSLKDKENEFLASLPKHILDELKTLCKHHSWFSKTNEQPKETVKPGFFTTEQAVQETTNSSLYGSVTADVSEAEMIETREDKIDKEFSLFMDIGNAAFMDNEAECSSFY